MTGCKEKSFAGKIQLLMETQQDFTQRFKQRLLFELSKVTNHFEFIGGLLSKGALSDRSTDSEGSFGLKEMMVQLAVMIAFSKGAHAIRSLMEALGESGNSALISALRTWVTEDFCIETDGSLSVPKEVNKVVETSTSEKSEKQSTNTTEFSSSATKLIDMVLSHEGSDLIEQLESHWLGMASNIVNAEQFCSSLAFENVQQDESGTELTAGQQLVKGQWTANAIKAACSKKAIGSLVVAFQRSGNGQILQETLEWLETSQARNKNYPIAVKSLANQRLRDEFRVIRCAFFRRASVSNGLEKVATFNCQLDPSSEGKFALQFNADRMIAYSTDGTTSLRNWRQNEEKKIKFGLNLKDITCFQYDEEIAILGTAGGTVHLFDVTTMAEMWTVRLDEPVQSLKFVEYSLVILTRGVYYDNFWWIEISRADMQLRNQRSVTCLSHTENAIFFIEPEYSFLYMSGYVYVYFTISGEPVVDHESYTCSFEAPAVISAFNVLDLTTTKCCIAGCKDGTICMWNSYEFVWQQSPIKTLEGHTAEVVSLCAVRGHLLSLDQNGKLLMWSGYDLENENIGSPVPRVLAENFCNGNVTNLFAYERWFASISSEDGIASIWTLPELWLRTG